MPSPRSWAMSSQPNARYKRPKDNNMHAVLYTVHQPHTEPSFKDRLYKHINSLR